MWKPAGHRVIVRPDEAPDKIGSVFVPVWVKENKAFEIVQGEIIEIGMNAWKAFDDGKPWAKVGDRVMFAKYGGSIVEEGGVKYRILNDEDIICIWREE